MINKTWHYLTVAQYFFLGCMLGTMAGIWIHNPKPKDIEFINAFNGNRTIVHLRPNGQGVIEEWTNKTAEELLKPFTPEEFERFKEQLKKAKVKP